MNTFLLLLTLLFTFAILILAFFALSSCLGDEIRAAWSGRRSNSTIPTTFGLQYARLMSSQSSGGGGWEGIEMQEMLDENEDKDRRR